MNDLVTADVIEKIIRIIIDLPRLILSIIILYFSVRALIFVKTFRLRDLLRKRLGIELLEEVERDNLSFAELRSFYSNRKGSSCHLKKEGDFFVLYDYDEEFDGKVSNVFRKFKYKSAEDDIPEIFKLYPDAPLEITKENLDILHLKTLSAKNGEKKSAKKMSKKSSHSSLSENEFEAKPVGIHEDVYYFDAELQDNIDRFVERVKNADSLSKFIVDEDLDVNKNFLLLVGQAGCGKSTIAKLVCKKLGKQMIEVRIQDVDRHLVGKGNETVKKIFKQASDQDAVLFFEEADSFISSKFVKARSSNDLEENSMRNTFKTELESFDGVVIFATNLDQCDKAIENRVEKIFVPMPTKETRKKIWERKLLKIKEANRLSEDVDLDEIASFELVPRTIRNLVLREFIPIAEKTNLTQEIMKETIKKFLDEKKSLKKSGFLDGLQSTFQFWK